MEGSTIISPALPRTKKHRTAHGRPRVPHVGLVIGLGVATLTIAVVLGSIYGVPASVAFVGCVTGLCALAKALLELGVFLEKRSADAAVPAPRRRHRSVVLVVCGGVVLGILIGYIVLPLLIDWALQPLVRITIPNTVLASQPISVVWHNIPQTDDVRVLVRATDMSASFVAPCRSPGGRRGRLSCDLEIGGADDAGRRYELRIVRVPHSVSAQLETSALEPSYITGMPDGSQVLAMTTVTRKVQ